MEAIDVYGSAYGSSTTATQGGLTPTNAGEGAIYFTFNNSYYDTSVPVGWTNTGASSAGNVYAVISILGSPTQGSALSASWNWNQAGPWATVGVIVFAAGQGKAQSRLLPLLSPGMIAKKVGKLWAFEKKLIFPEKKLILPGIVLPAPVPA
jgi:hypothetical protein